MNARIAVACVCVLVGLGAIVGVASTAGPPDGYRVFHADDVRVDLPTAFATVDPNVPLVHVLGPDGARVDLTTTRTRGRSLTAMEAATVADHPDLRATRREDVDVSGADEARRIAFAGAGRVLTVVIARDGDRFVTLSIAARDDTPKRVLDAGVVEDALAISG